MNSTKKGTGQAAGGVASTTLEWVIPAYPQKGPPVSGVLAPPEVGDVYLNSDHPSLRLVVTYIGHPDCVCFMVAGGRYGLPLRLGQCSWNDFIVWASREAISKTTIEEYKEGE